MKLIFILLFSISVYSQQFLKLDFNEPLDISSVQTATYIIMPVFGQGEYIPTYPLGMIDDSTVVLYTGQHDEGLYKVIVKGITDVAGNEINMEKNFAYYQGYIKSGELNGQTNNINGTNKNRSGSGILDDHNQSQKMGKKQD